MFLARRDACGSKRHKHLLIGLHVAQAILPDTVSDMFTCNTVKQYNYGGYIFVRGFPRYVPIPSAD